MVSDKETNIYNTIHLSPTQVGKSENQQAFTSTRPDRPKSAIEKKVTRSEDKTVGCCCLTKSKSKMNHDTMKIIDISILKNAHAKYTLTTPSQNIHTPVKSIGCVEMKDPTLNQTEINIHHQSAILNSSLTDHNCHNSESSVDLQNLFMESNENKSLLPLHSRYFVSFEFANREEHLVEVAELERSFYRVSRMNIYKTVRERLAIMDLIDIDLTTLLRVILQSFP
ncbi:unnamed protein product [Rotaria sp. Silwood2]|nr:unnamed protein product [Rotaria sp. Silwood2]CAF2801913.1 unnamed protein product [Rotaria sp. Silwood2]CAF2999746.1 unnamed protein product [Rotaria sp. Silwood2]CAF3162626.1 unnamed protein product [Rotaria sp. Silwood2]